VTKATTLWSLATIKGYLGIAADETAKDQVLSLIGDGVSELLERELQRLFVTRTLVEVHNGHGGHLLYLRQYPVVSLTSITVLRSPGDVAPEVMDPTDYMLNAQVGLVHAFNDRFTRGVGNVTVTYSAGHGVQDAATLPSDAVQIGLDLVKLVFDERDTGVIAASTVSVGSANVVLKPDWPKHILLFLKTARRPRV